MHWKTWIIGSLLAVIHHLALAAEPGLLSKKEWYNHPDIVEIRQIYRQIEATRDFVEQQREQECLTGVLLQSYQAFRQPSNRQIRKLVLISGTEESMLTRRYYYDAQQRLRFIHATASGMYYKGKSEERLYYNGAGQLLYRDRQGQDRDIFDYRPLERIDHPEQALRLTCEN